MDLVSTMGYSRKKGQPVVSIKSNVIESMGNPSRSVRSPTLSDRIDRINRMINSSMSGGGHVRDVPNFERPTVRGGQWRGCCSAVQTVQLVEWGETSRGTPPPGHCFTRNTGLRACEAAAAGMTSVVCREDDYLGSELLRHQGCFLS